VNCYKNIFKKTKKNSWNKIWCKIRDKNSFIENIFLVYKKDQTITEVELRMRLDACFRCDKDMLSHHARVSKNILLFWSNFFRENHCEFLLPLEESPTLEQESEDQELVLPPPQAFAEQRAGRGRWLVGRRFSCSDVESIVYWTASIQGAIAYLPAFTMCWFLI